MKSNTGTPLEGTRLTNRLREWRIEMDWTLAEMSGITGLSVSALSRLERGHRGASPRTRVLIARRLGVDIADLFDVEELPDDEVA